MPAPRDNRTARLAAALRAIADRIEAGSLAAEEVPAAVAAAVSAGKRPARDAVAGTVSRTFVPDAADLWILAALADAGVTLRQAPLLARLQEFDPEDNGLSSRSTLVPRLARLRDAGLIHRPNGDRYGDTVTDAGRAVLAEFGPGADRAQVVRTAGAA